MGVHNSVHNSWQDICFCITEKYFLRHNIKLFRLKISSFITWICSFTILNIWLFGTIWMGWLTYLSSVHLALCKYYISVNLGKNSTQKLTCVFVWVNFKSCSIQCYICRRGAEYFLNAKEIFVFVFLYQTGWINSQICTPRQHTSMCQGLGSWRKSFVC